MTSDIGNATSPPSVSVKLEDEFASVGGAFDEGMNTQPSVQTQINIPAPNIIVEVAIPPHPTSLEAYQRISAPIDVDAEEEVGDLAQPEHMRSENAKVKKEAFRLPESTIAKYINFYGLRSTEVPQDDDAQRDINQTIRREFLSNEYGGSPQELLSRPKAAKVAIHGHHLFVCPMIAIHPWAPQMPGQPGLIFYCPPRSYNDPWDDEGEFACIAGLQPGKWLYTGRYKWRGHGVLASDEWLGLPHYVRRNWIAYTTNRPWSVDLRMSIRLRRELGREPSRLEVEKASKAFKRNGPTDDVTPEEIMGAFDKGKECLRILGLVCARYDIDLQREFISKQARWYRNGAPGLTVVKKKSGAKNAKGTRKGARDEVRAKVGKKSKTRQRTVDSVQTDPDAESDGYSSPASASVSLRASPVNTRGRAIRVPRRFVIV